MNPAAQQFDRVAAAYATSAVHARGQDLAWLVDALQPRPNWEVADLGTGAGHAALAVAPHAGRVHALDVSERMLHTARTLAAERGIGNITFYQARVESPPLPHESIDAIISRFSAHHWADPTAALKAAHILARPGAPLVLIDSACPDDPALDTFINALELLRDPSHARNATITEWRARLEAAGFQVEKPREWTIELETEEWLARAGTEPWRADACRHLLGDAPPAVRAAFAIAEDGSRFRLHCALLKARRADA